MAEEFASSENQKIAVVVRSRSKTYYDGQVTSITSTNETGVFDVLPQHANFITMIQEFVNVSLPSGEEKKFEIKTGVLRVFRNKADIYLTV